MTNYAVLSGDTVSNIIVADSVANAELATGSTCIEYIDINPVGIGWTYDGTVFTTPVVEPVVEPTE